MVRSSRNRSNRWLTLALMPLFAAVCLLDPVAAGAQVSEADTDVIDEGEGPVIEEEAMEILKRLSDYLAGTEVFYTEWNYGFDVVQDDGQKIEFGARREATVRRPNQAVMEYHRRDGEEGTMIFDGEAVWAYDPDENVYATVPQPGDIDKTLDFVIFELGINQPQSDFFSSDIYRDLSAKIREAYYVGESTVGELPCDHLAFRGDDLDFQLWVARGDKPLPYRLVVTYRDEPGQPQFRAQMTKWDLAPKITDATFKFTPPEGSRRIRFAVVVPDKTGSEEGASQ